MSRLMTYLAPEVIDRGLILQHINNGSSEYVFSVPILNYANSFLWKDISRRLFYL